MTVDGLGELQQKRDKATKASRLSRNVPPPLNPRKHKEGAISNDSFTKAAAAAVKIDGIEEVISTRTIEGDTSASSVSTDFAEDSQLTSQHYVRKSPTRAVSSYDHGDGGEPWGESSRQVTVYVLPETKRLASRTAKRQKKTNATIALDALDAVRERLHELVEERQNRQRPEGSMFLTRRVHGGRQTIAGAPRDPFIMRILPSDFEVLEELSEEHGARGISEIVSVALEDVYSRARVR